MPDDHSSFSKALFEQRWCQTCSRDRKADGVFVRAVTTTGVYCRPSCGARLPNRSNVRFYDTPAMAEAAGYRTCRRCSAEGETLETEHLRLVARACRLMDRSEQILTAGQLAQALGISPSHFHRLFKAATGLTPRAYSQEQRGARVRRNLSREQTVTATLYDAGFGSSGRFYEASLKILGMKPDRYRKGGIGEVLRFAIGLSSLGHILVASSDKGVVAILLGDDPETLLGNLQDRFPFADLIGADPHYDAMVATVVGMVENPRQGAELPLDLRGSAFQKRVWRALREIAVGETISYSELAQRVGGRKSVLAVAAACASNPMAVAIPCHRVVRRSGQAWGYAWGLERKFRLLELEG
ncbi:bifunctional DNA-binding transcriptional regulator/O6-methylguanine-DNA methyltransferase Ada [Asticcacaulis sp. DXS10W]|uniref:Bifunctional DNA-binding transcriptional regulator/O6-methylguanine-DNA methyltransferase Ada n=1 Tax=Asticcacaulis currens TaxID=2984210 RepID=A0ABT5IBD0_9CAUL|nr:bifunctional DNA-binding transcriptional regulator/O6-methylguanine-DNA methyltransferase Ada [Asticcacaulis currens]MDC7693464.1 bifunctional DNA-binding transcriptional regulator/O6-methylguanine-DNA methyltransferase Ada [Asticcacaulis currens]